MKQKVFFLILTLSLNCVFGGTMKAVRFDKIYNRPLIKKIKFQSNIKKEAPISYDFFRIPSSKKERFSPRKKSLLKTQVKILYDDKNLIIYFYCIGGLLKKKKKTIRRGVDTRVWKEDYVDLAIDTNNDKETYFYLAVNTSGETWDSFCAAPYKVNSKWQSRAEIDIREKNDGWTMLIKIPWASLGMKPGIGDIIGMTFGRTQYLDSKSLQVIMPEDGVVIDYEKKLKELKNKDASSTTPFASYNWYYPQKKMYLAPNFKEFIISGDRKKPVLCSTRGVLRETRFPYNNEFLIFARNVSNTEKRYSLCAFNADKKIKEVQKNTAAGQVCTLKLKYNVKDLPIRFVVEENNKIIYESTYSFLPGLPNLKKRKLAKKCDKSLWKKTAGQRLSGGVYWPHHLDYAPSTSYNTRYYNTWGFGIEHNLSNLLDYIAMHRISPMMMWNRLGVNKYNELKYFLKDFRKRNIKCFLAPSVRVSYDYERNKSFQAGKVKYPVINGRVYLFHPEVKKTDYSQYA